MSGGRWTDEQRAEALELYAAHGLPEAVRRTGIPRSTIDRWAKAAGATSGSREQSRRSTEAARTSKAAAHAAARATFAERLAAVADERAALAESLITDMAPTAAEQLARRLNRAEQADELVDEAWRRWRDCRVLEAHAADMGPDNAREARSATREALADLEAAERLAVPLRELLAILDSSVRGYVALEGAAGDDRAAGELIVELLVPEPQPTTVVPEAELPERR